MLNRTKYTNSGIARKAITIFLSYGHPFELGYRHIENLTYAIEFTFKYKQQGELKTITIEPVDTSDLTKIKELIDRW